MADEARMRNRQSVHMARMWCGARDSAVLEGVVWQSFRLDGRKVCNIKRADISQVNVESERASKID